MPLRFLLELLPLGLLTIPVLAVPYNERIGLDPPSSPLFTSIPLLRRSPAHLDLQTNAELGEWARRQAAWLTAKYGQRQDSWDSSSPQSSTSKRHMGTNLLVNQNIDSTYFGTISVGTPPSFFNVILDTGSADLWLASTDCTPERGCAEELPKFDPEESSSFVSHSTEFNVGYGGGSASGHLASDTIQMAGFEVSSQVIGVVDSITDKLLASPVSGLMGLAFESASTTRTTPFWLHLARAGAWDEPVMAFYLTRYKDSSSRKLEPGGSFTMGGLDSSLYTGDIDYVDLVDDSQWILRISALTVQGNSIHLPGGSSANVAIDTGTTLIGGPPSYLDELFSHIPDSQAGEGDFSNYYTYPCDTNVTMTIAFGGTRSWTIDPKDFQLMQLQETGRCVASLFKLSIGGTAPQWIVGDTFLKNVYSVFRYDPPSIGFADLSTTAKEQFQLDNLSLPTPTNGAVITVAGNASRNSNPLSHLSFLNPRTFILSSSIMFWALSLLY